MEVSQNKTVLGIMVILILLFAVSIFFYNRTLNDLASVSCTDSSIKCPHEKVVETQNIVIAALIGMMVLVAGWLAYQTYGKKARKQDAPEDRQTPQKNEAQVVHPVQKKVDTSSLDSDEKKIVEIIREKGGSVFQSEVISKLGYSKVKISRLLDRLEQKGIVERKRRGMANLVVLK